MDAKTLRAATGIINGIRVQINYEFDASGRPDSADDYDWDDVYSLTIVDED